MKLLPEQIEGKIFALILIICLSMSLLSARLIVAAREGAMLSEYRNSLADAADHRVAQIRDRFANWIDEAYAANRVIEEALLEAREDSSFVGLDAAPSLPTSYPDKVTTYLEKPGALGPDAQYRLTVAVTALRYTAPIIRRDFSNFYVALQDEFVCISPAADPGQLRALDEAALQEKYALAGPSNNPERLAVWSDPYYNSQREQWFTSLIFPLYDEDRFLGVTGSDYSLDALFSELQPLTKDPRLATAYIFDSSGRLIAHPSLETAIRLGGTDSNWGLPLVSIPDPRVRRLVERYQMLSPEGEKSLHLSFKAGDAEHIGYVAPMGALDWKLAVVAGSERMDGQLTALRWQLSLAAVIAALILVFLLRACFRQFFIDRVVELEAATRAFTQGGIVDFPESGKDEVGRLVVAFKEMVQSLASREAELTVRNQQLKNEISGRLSAVESLRESERKFRTLFDKSSDAILVFDGDRLIDCNEAAVHMLECLSKEELLATPLEDFAPEFQQDGTPSTLQARRLFALAAEKGKHRYEWLGRTANSREFWVDALITRVPYGGRDVFYMVWRDITTRKEEDEERIRLTTAIEQAAEVIIVTDPSGTILYVNPSFERLTGYTPEETLGTVSDLLGTHTENSKQSAEIWEALEQGETWKGRVANKRTDGTMYQAETTISPVRDASGVINNFVIVSYDVTKEASLEAQLLQAHKMEAIGELASGIAHEINTPTQYIGDNIRFFQESFGDIQKLLDKYHVLLQTVKSDQPAQKVAGEIDALIGEIELDYLNEELPIAIEQSLEGNSRVAEIVRAMKEFAHPGIEEMTAIDINHAIRNTIAVARNEWKYVADVITDFDPDLPDVPCLPGSFNQVMLNIIVNAAHAIGDVVKERPEEKGKITIRTRSVDSWAEIRIEDSGPGIPEKIRTKIFDPFFTTKDPGKGTGQGLALVHAVIVEKHKGTIEVETEAGKGTTFIVRVPFAVIPELEEEPETVAAKLGQ